MRDWKKSFKKKSSSSISNYYEKLTRAINDEEIYKVNKPQKKEIKSKPSSKPINIKPKVTGSYKKCKKCG